MTHTPTKTDSKSVKISYMLNRESREISVVEGEYGGTQKHLRVDNVAIKTISGKKIHCGSICIDPKTHKILSIDYRGALGNGSGLGSKIQFIDWADKYPRDLFSNTTLPTYDKFNPQEEA